MNWSVKTTVTGIPSMLSGKNGFWPAFLFTYMTMAASPSALSPGWSSNGGVGPLPPPKLNVPPPKRGFGRGGNTIVDRRRALISMIL